MVGNSVPRFDKSRSRAACRITRNACRRSGWFPILLVVLLAPIGTSSGRNLPTFTHVFVIIMENREASAVLESSDAPSIRSLADLYAVAAHHYAIAHPSLPNYLALTGGDAFGITSDCVDCILTASNLIDQLEDGHKTWKAYMEGLPSPCFTGPASTDGYAKKHNPFMYYTDVSTNPARCGRIVPLSQLDDDIGHEMVPDFVWITPNLCHSMHDCSTRDGDRWLGAIASRILASPAWKDGGVLFLVWDEGRGNAGCCGHSGGGRVALLAISPLARRGYRSDVESNHYSLLRTIEDIWSLGHLRHAGDFNTQPMLDLFQGGKQ